MRIALGIEYDGSQFHGWQAQPDLRTVQEELSRAVAKVADHDVTISCAGRTDTGVHATAQVVHFDCEVNRNVRAWLYGVNSHLPKDITVRWSKAVDENFHARYSALERHYRYLIYNHPIRPALFNHVVTWQYRPLDDSLMHEGAQYLIGKHDFTSFRAITCQSNSATRRITSFTVKRHGDLIVMDVKANAFLHHMVRNLAGVLIIIGTAKREPRWAKEVLEAKDRSLGAATAPAYGLYLVDVTYPEEYRLPRSIIGPLFLTEFFK